MTFGPSELMSKRRAAGIVALCWVALFSVGSAHAETTAKDIQVILKTAGFLTPKPSGPTVVNVIFDPADAASKKDAEAIKGYLDAITSGPLVPTARLVPITQLSGLDGPLAILAAGTAAAGQGALADAVKGRKILTVSSDGACARAGKCVLAVRADPKVEILFNTAAGKAAEVEFMPAFRMMITEL
jgi:hypothetical protein